MKILRLELEIDDDEYEEFLEHEEVQGNLTDFFFALLCQNYGIGFLTHCSITNVGDDGD